MGRLEENIKRLSALKIEAPVLDGNVTDRNQNDLLSNNYEVAPPQELTDRKSAYELWQEQNPDKGVYEYNYITNIEKPRQLDQKAVEKRRKLAALTDLGLLLTEGVGAAMGGSVNRRRESATENLNREQRRLYEVFERNQRIYNEGFQNSIGRDSQTRYSENQYKINRANKLTDYTTGRNDKITDANNQFLNSKVLYELRTADNVKAAKTKQEFDAQQLKERQEFEANQTNKTIEASKQNKERDIESRKEISAAKPDKNAETQAMYDTYNALVSEHANQRKSYDEAFKRDKNVNIGDYVKLPLPSKTPTAAQVEAYVRLYGGGGKTKGTLLPGQKSTKKGSLLP